MPPRSAPVLYLGLMSGTSMDGVDAALLALEDEKLRILAARTFPYPGELADRIAALARGIYGREDPVALLGRLDAEVAEAFAEAALGLLAAAGVAASAVRAIGSHGQTVRHAPEDRPSYTIQIGDPGRIAIRTGIPTVGDFRRQDMALGGQGAPLVPLFHREVFGDPGETRAVLNLGGIANVTVIEAGRESALGFDTGPGNTLLDAWARRTGLGRCDRDGALARRGRLDEALLGRLLDEPYFALPPPKSTGPERFSLAWLEARLGSPPVPDPADVARTLVELTARTAGGAAASRTPPGARVVLCGGGVHHPLLVEALTRICAPRPVVDTGAFGIDPDFVEAAAFAWFAHRRLEGLSGNLPEATGARRATVLGGVYLPR